MLKDRIVVDENGFQVNRESADPERKAYYATFTLADEEIDKSQGKQIKYWDAMNPYSQRVQPNSYVYIWETKDEIMVDECRIYLGNGRAKPRISWSIEKEQAYGDYAYMIRLKWIPSFGEGFHMEDERNQEYPVRRVFEEKEEENRTKAVYKLYLNPSQADRDLYLYHMDEPTGLDKFLKRHKKRRLDILNNIGKTRNS